MIFYEEIHSAIDKLKNGEQPSESEVEEIIKVLENAKGKWIPTEEELRDYKQNIEDVNIYNKKLSTSHLVEPILKKMDEYDKKYHPGE